MTRNKRGKSTFFAPVYTAANPLVTHIQIFPRIASVVRMILSACQLEGAGPFAGATHFSPWSYDRRVPLAIYGTPFLPGEYYQRVAPSTSP